MSKDKGILDVSILLSKGARPMGSTSQYPKRRHKPTIHNGGFMNFFNIYLCTIKQVEVTQCQTTNEMINLLVTEDTFV